MDKRLLQSLGMILMLTAIGLVLVSIRVQQPYYQGKSIELTNYGPKNNLQQVTIPIPENVTNDLVESLIDIFWDQDGDCGCTDLATIIWSFVPGFGANGAIMIYPIFLVTLFGGMAIFRYYVMARLK